MNYIILNLNTRHKP